MIRKEDFYDKVQKRKRRIKILIKRAMLSSIMSIR